jgi:hypothetical protein
MISVLLKFLEQDKEIDRIEKLTKRGNEDSFHKTSVLEVYVRIVVKG